MMDQKGDTDRLNGSVSPEFYGLCLFNDEAVR